MEILSRIRGATGKDAAALDQEKSPRGGFSEAVADQLAVKICTPGKSQFRGEIIKSHNHLKEVVDELRAREPVRSGVLSILKKTAPKSNDLIEAERAYATFVSDAQEALTDSSQAVEAQKKLRVAIARDLVRKVISIKDRLKQKGSTNGNLTAEVQNALVIASPHDGSEIAKGIVSHTFLEDLFSQLRVLVETGLIDDLQDQEFLPVSVSTLRDLYERIKNSLLVMGLPEMDDTVLK